jgi:hypothetical protein
MPPKVFCSDIYWRLASNGPCWTWLNATVTLVCSPSDFPSRWTSLTLHRAKELPIFVSTTVEAHKQRSLHRVLQFTPRINAIYLISLIYSILYNDRNHRYNAGIVQSNLSKLSKYRVKAGWLIGPGKIYVTIPSHVHPCLSRSLFFCNLLAFSNTATFFCLID